MSDEPSIQILPMRDLWQLMKIGHAEARQEFCRRYGRHIETRARAKRRQGLWSSKEPEDIAQSVLRSILESLDTLILDDTRRVKQLLAIKADGKVIDSHRREHLDQRKPLPPEPPGAQQGSDADSEPGRREAWEWILQRLTPDERRLVGLRFVLELSWEQIGEQLGVTGDAVRVRCFRVRKKLYDILQTTVDTGQGEWFREYLQEARSSGGPTHER